MKNTEIQKQGWFEVQSQKFEEKRFFQMTLLITAQSCWGSIAAMLSLQHENYILLSIVAALTMASNSAFIAQSPAKWCLGIFYTSVIANLLVIVSLLLM